jgi:hypothetical protein
MDNYVIISADYFTDIEKNNIDEIVISNSYSKELVYSPFEWSSYLRNYIILTHIPSVIKNIKFDKLSLYMSRYYWFKKFYHSYSLMCGKDVGIEQQIIQLLESISYEFKNFDWYEIQKINQNIETQSN